MSRASQKSLMRDALKTTEGNLTSLIGVRYDAGGSFDNDVMVQAMVLWRDVVRKALGSFPNSGIQFPPEQAA